METLLQSSEKTSDQIIKNGFESKKMFKVVYLVELILFFIILLGATGIMAQEKKAFDINETVLEEKMVDFKKFHVIQNSGKIYINWVVQNMTEEVTYFVERSNNNYNYTIIGFKTGISSPVELLYSYIDKTPPTGKTYYRIKKVSNNGDIVVSEVRAIGENENAIANTETVSRK